MANGTHSKTYTIDGHSITLRATGGRGLQVVWNDKPNGQNRIVAVGNARFDQAMEAAKADFKFECSQAGIDW